MARSIKVVAIATALIVSACVAGYVALYPSKLGKPKPFAGAVVKIYDKQSIGSGVHIGGGYVFTVEHVVGKQSTVSLKLDDNSIRKARVLWVNKAEDAALLYTDPRGLKQSPLSCKTPKVGDQIKAVGMPLGEEWVHTYGKVSSTRRPKTPSAESMWTIDITVAPGMSGGPIYKGAHVVGLVSRGLLYRGAIVNITFVTPGATLCKLIART